MPQAFHFSLGALSLQQFPSVDDEREALIWNEQLITLMYSSPAVEATLGLFFLERVLWFLRLLLKKLSKFKGLTHLQILK